MNFNNTKNINSALFLVSVLLTACGGGGGGEGAGATASDTTPPTVISTTHANNATNVSVNSAITATFSEAMAVSTITASTFTLSGGATGTVTYDATNNIATYTPSANLAYSTTYTATITTGVKDSAGNAMAANYIWSFTTGSAPDTTPPFVSVTNPANNATGVAVSSAITVTFSEAMTASTINIATFTISNGVTGTVTYTGTTATFTPTGNLAYSTAYTATITAGVKDSAGNIMAVNYTWSFTTGTAPSTSEVTISASASSGGTWSGGNPDTFTPNTPRATVSVTEIESRLIAATSVIITTSAAVIGDGDILVRSPVSWSANTLTLTAERDIIINAVMTASGTSVLSLNHEPSAGAAKVGFNAGGTYKGRVDFAGRSGAGIITIGGYGYTVINDVTALQNMCITTFCMYAIGSNFDASATSTWNAGLGFAPVGTGPAASFAGFYGRFDGLGHTITGLTINRPSADYVGLFGFGNGAKIRNVGLNGGSVIGRDFVGGLVGYTWSNASDKISNSYYTGAVTGFSTGNGSVGGLVGANYGSITNSYSTGNVSGVIAVGGLVGWNRVTGAISSSYSTGAVIGGVGSSAIGGLVGLNDGGIANSYSTRSVSGTDFVGGLVGQGGGVTNSYSAGSVNGSTNVGGLVGYYASGTIASSYWDTNTSGKSNCAGFGSNAGCTGLSTAQMKQQASFSAWDFANIWRIDEGVSYPTLLIFQSP